MNNMRSCRRSCCRWCCLLLIRGCRCWWWRWRRLNRTNDRIQSSEILTHTFILKVSKKRILVITSGTVSNQIDSACKAFRRIEFYKTTYETKTNDFSEKHHLHSNHVSLNVTSVCATQTPIDAKTN